MSSTPISTRRWLNGDAIYEGFPIYFRRVDIRVSEYPSLSVQYPNLVVFTHYLKQVKANGLPETDYNNSLEQLDSALVDTFHAGDRGVAGLIETFAGKRTYYFYARVGLEVDAILDTFAKRFGNEKFEWKVRPDPGWKLLNGYARDFDFA